MEISGKSIADIENSITEFKKEHIEFSNLENLNG
jgi:hypothetical protein